MHPNTLTGTRDDPYQPTGCANHPLIQHTTLDCLTTPRFFVITSLAAEQINLTALDMMNSPQRAAFIASAPKVSSLGSL